MVEYGALIMAKAYDTCNQKSGYHKHDAVSDALISGDFFSVFGGCDSKVGTAETTLSGKWMECSREPWSVSQLHRVY